MKDCKTVKTPLLAGLALIPERRDQLPDLKPFWKLVCTMMYLADTLRPDICYAVNHLAQSIHDITATL